MKPPVYNLGTGKWIRTWVSKTDVVEFQRCPYRLSFAYREGIPIEDLKRPEIIRALIERGVKFEETTLKEVPHQETKSLERMVGEDVTISAPLLIQNNDRGIRGMPDLIYMGKGRVYPIEVKYHRSLADTDRLELAFYWRLLEPMRKSLGITAKGFVLLNTGKTIEVTISEADLSRIDTLVDQARWCKDTEVAPSISPECKVCTLTVECERVVLRDGGLSLIHGVLQRRESDLFRLGISNIRDLAACDGTKLYNKWRKLRTPCPGVAQIRIMQLHAKAYASRSPIRFGAEPFPVGERFIVLDLEYNFDFNPIFLIGLAVVGVEKTATPHQYFAKTPDDEKKILAALNRVLEKNHRLPIVTWSGTTADIPALSSAWQRLGLKLSRLDDIEARHVDLAAYARDNFRFPTKSFGLGGLERYFGYKRDPNDAKSIEMPFLYEQFETSPSRKEKQELRGRILRHNEEDLSSTLFILTKLRVLSRQRAIDMRV